MANLKSLFGRKAKTIAEPMQGLGSQVSDSDQDVTRKHMEADMAADKERREETTTKA